MDHKGVVMKNHRKMGLSLLIIMILTSAGLLSALETGDSVPSFSVVSGDGKILIQSDLIGKNTLLFYEDRSKMDLNEDLKDYLVDQGYSEDQTQLVVVADCSNAGLFKKIWQKQIMDESRKSGFTVYGDWNGNMKSVLKTASDTSTFFIVDPRGIVRFFMEGTVPDREFQKIHSTIYP